MFALSSMSQTSPHLRSAVRDTGFYLVLRRGQPLGLLLLLLVGALFCLWQWREFEADKTAAEGILRRQAETLFQAVVGAIRSHRRLGAFFDQQIQTVLDELVDARDVLAVSIFDQHEHAVLQAGQAFRGPLPNGSGLVSDGYLLKKPFEMPALPPGGPGTGGGRGFGWGRWQREGQEDGHSPFASGGRFSVALLLDRSEYNAQVDRALRNRAVAVVTGLFSLILLGTVSLLALKATEAEHNRRLAEMRVQHYEELGQAASGLAHAIRNPLGLIRGWAQRIAQAPQAQPTVVREAQLIMEECDRLAARLTQFLDFAKPCQPKRELVSPDVVIRELLDLLEPDTQGKGLRFQHIPASPEGRILADAALFRQALFDLLHNAAKFSPPGGVIQVRTSFDGPNCVIEIADEGPGVAPENVARLFTPYFTTDPQGTGLGLAMVRRIAEAHGGTVQYQPAAGKGAAFRLVIPCEKSAEHTEC